MAGGRDLSESCEEGLKKWIGDTYMICLDGRWVPYADTGATNKPLKVTPDGVGEDYDVP